jgi:hypothetical protein
MKKTLTVVLAFLLLLFSCKSVADNGSHQTEKKNPSTEHEADPFFELGGFEYSIDPGNSVRKQDDIYDMVYDIGFVFKTNKPVGLTFKIYDIDNNLLYEKKDIKSGGVSLEKKEFTFKDRFTDSFSHSILLYYLDVEINKKNYEYTGEFENTSVPSIEDCSAGHVITKYENRKINVSFYIDLRIKNCSEVTWVRLIPPSKQYYWSLQTKPDGDSMTANGVISDAKHINYIDNGTYILQINLGRLGIIQKEIDLTDYLGNKSGPNYGMPVASEKNSDKNGINLNIDFPDKVDYYEIWLFEDNARNSRKLGSAKFEAAATSLPKKELFESFFDDSDNRVKLKYNKKYYYRIYLYSKEINGLKYISISDPISVTFQGFSLFGF